MAQHQLVKEQPTMPTIQEKTARLEAARIKVEEFVAAGGDLKSPAAAPLGLELIKAADELGREFGHEILKPVDGFKQA